MIDLDDLPANLEQIERHFLELRDLVEVSSYRHQTFTDYAYTAHQASKLIQSNIDRVKETRTAPGPN